MISIIIGATVLLIILILAQEVRIAKIHKQLKKVENVIFGKIWKSK